MRGEKGGKRRGKKATWMGTGKTEWGHQDGDSNTSARGDSYGDGEIGTGHQNGDAMRRQGHQDGYVWVGGTGMGMGTLMGTL